MDKYNQLRRMKVKHSEHDPVVVEILSQTKFSADEIGKVFGKYGNISRIDDASSNVQTVHFQTEEQARQCAADENSILIKMNATDSNFECVGDTNNANRKFDFVRKVFGNLVRSKTSSRAVDLPSCEVGSSSLNESAYMPNCSSPVLLNTVEPGFRMAYCHDIIDLREDPKTRKLNEFNRSIKKYLDNTPRIGTQEIVITNLPPDFSKEDVYMLCEDVEPAEVELKTTSNVNILYANVKTKSVDDFDRLTKVLCGRRINGTRIATIPITKITESNSTKTTESEAKY